MNTHADEMRRCLLYCDVCAIRRLWQHIAPHLPQPKDDRQALLTIHMARLEMKSLPEKEKQYSRDWLREHEQPVIARAVGIAVGSPADWQISRVAERLTNVRGQMEQAVVRSLQDGLDLASEADNREISRRMREARLRA